MMLWTLWTMMVRRSKPERLSDKKPEKANTPGKSKMPEK